MDLRIALMYLVALSMRRISRRISLRNAARLIKEGAVEYGAFNTKLLGSSFMIFYLGCFVEAAIRKTQFDAVTIFGIVLYFFAISFLGLVIHQLQGVWTGRILILPRHTLKRSFIFKYFRHPNYFLNVIPELIAIMLICKAWFMGIVVLPIF